MKKLLPKIIYSKNEIEEILKSLLKKKQNKIITYFNQHNFNIYFNDVYYRQILDNCIIYLDGMGMYLALKLWGMKNIDNFNASDFNYQLLNLFIKEQTNIFFIGGNFDKSFVENFCQNKNIRLVGYFNGYFNDDVFTNLLDMCKNAQPDVIILGLGVPKQEKIALQLSKEINCDYFLCVGNFLEFYFGTIKRAPIFLRNTGFEWIFRLMTEPNRLWKRYIFGIPLFIYRIILIKIKGTQ